MSTQLWLDNVLAYSLQVVALVAAAGLASTLLRMRNPASRLLFWRIALAGCLALPLLQPWTREVVVLTNRATSAPWRAVQSAPAATAWSWTDAVMWLLAAGILLRGGWLLLGLTRLRTYRRSAEPLGELSARLRTLRDDLAPRAELAISTAVSGPITFGVRRPLVLLPPQFVRMAEAQQYAIVCHELLHVARRDWLFTVCEEAVRAALWFHPAVWWLLGQIQLTREQTVDRAVLGITQSANEYVDALMAAAGAKPQLDLAPAPLFLRKRHLKRRVVAILEDIPMSKERLLPVLTAGVTVMAAAAWLAVHTFPLAAAPQMAQDAEGVSVEVDSAALAHRTAVAYPAELRRKGVGGAVTVEVTLAADGAVTDARIISGPEALRRSVLESVLRWHFTRAGAPGMKTFSIAFQPGAGGAATPGRRLLALPPGVESLTVSSLDVRGLSPQAEQELRAKLPVRLGAPANEAALVALQEAVAAYDEHLQVGLRPGANKDLAVQVFTAEAGPANSTLPPPAEGVQRLRVGGNMQQEKLINKPRPVYPAEAKQARIQGVVQFEALIDREGKVAALSVISGHPLLVASATEAVRQWTYRPTLLNGNPVEVITRIDVNYTLAP